MARRSGRRHKVIPKMYLKCPCGETLATVQMKNGYMRPIPFDSVERVMVGAFNSNSHRSFEPGKNIAWNFEKTLDLKCEYSEHRTPSPTPKRDPERSAKLSEIRRVHGWLTEPNGGELGTEETSHANRSRTNPAAYTEAGFTQSPKDIKRENKRCGRHHVIRTDTVLRYWNQLAGVDDDTAPDEVPHVERRAFLAAGKHWEMRLN